MMPKLNPPENVDFSRPTARFGSPHRLRRQGVFRPMSNDHVSPWIACVYTVHVIMFPRGFASFDIVTVLLNLLPRTPRVQPVEYK